MSTPSFFLSGSGGSGSSSPGGGSGGSWSDEPELFEVGLVSGKTLKVMSETEAEWFTETRDTYLAQTKFTETTDLRDLDRLLVLELMTFRWTQHLAAGVGYDGFDIDPEQLRKNIKEYSDQINKVKESMGLNKKSRDDIAADGNFAQWLGDLKARAKIFGIHRENQLTKALILINQLSGIVGTFDRSDEEERHKTGFESEHAIVEWIRHTLLPEYKAIDEHFRANEQRYWIRTM